MKLVECMKVVEDDKKVISPASRIPYYPLAVKSASGAIVVDEDGNQFIDLLSSAGVINVGHSHPKVVEAIIEQSKKYIHYTSAYMYNKSLVELAEKLVKITPGDSNKRVSFGLSGSDANDGMIKLARAYTGRSKVVSFIGAYHGSTYGAISLSAISLNMRRKIGPLLPDVFHFSYPDCYRCKFEKECDSCNLECFNEIETAFESYMPAEEVAAIFIEPIQGDAGIIVPPRKYIKKLFNLCKEKGILFVSEEVQQGFGRTGKWFGIEHFDVVPDAIIMGKAIASGLPLSAIVAREDIMQAWEAPAHLFSTAANPVCCQAALATIDVIEEENLLKHTQELGNYMKERFNVMKDKYELIGDVRGLGLSIGVDLVTDRKTKQRASTAAAKISYRCWEKGLILSFFSKSVLRIQPPLILTKLQADKAIDIIEESINEYLKGNIPDEVLKVAKGW